MSAAKDVFVHPSSFVDDGAKLGAGTKVWHFCHVMPGAVIGERCNIGQNCVIMPGVVLGTNVKLQNNVSVYEGVTLGRFAFVGAGAVVTRDVNDYALVVGNPARQIGWMCDCGERLAVAHGRGACARCGKRYLEEAGNLRESR